MGRDLRDPSIECVYMLKQCYLVRHSHMPHISPIYSLQLVVYSQNFVSFSTINCGRFLPSLKSFPDSFVLAHSSSHPYPCKPGQSLPSQSSAQLSAVSLDLVKPHVLFLCGIHTVGSSLECLHSDRQQVWMWHCVCPLPSRYAGSTALFHTHAAVPTGSA